MDVTIHPMAEEDVGEVLALWRSTEGVGLSSADTEAGIAMFLSRNPGLALVARDGERLVGAILCGHDGRRGYLHHLAVARSCRRRGIGRVLAGRCEESLRRLGIKKCHLFVFAQNTAAADFWRRIGWHLRDDVCVMSRDL